MNFKTLGLISMLVFLLFVAAKVLADVKAERIKLKISAACVERLENITQNIEGVIQTNWYEETGELEIMYKQNETSFQKIEQTISEAGFDTPNNKATEEAAAKVSEECKEKQPAGL